MNRITTLTSALVLSSALVWACSEATDGLPADAPSPEAAADSGVVDPTVEPAEDAAKAGPERDAADQVTITSDSGLLINEISGGDEWIELVNAGTSALDVSGYRVADLAKAGGAKLEEAVTLANGTILSPKAYLLVRGGGLDAGKGCPDGGQSYCVIAEFGISNKNGDTIFVLDDKGATVGQVPYPPAAAGAGESWSRLPSGDPSGAFAKAKETPGAANVAP